MTYGSSSGLDYHIQAKHDGVSFDCDKCEAKYTTQHKLEKHIERQHTIYEDEGKFLISLLI